MPVPQQLTHITIFREPTLLCYQVLYQDFTCPVTAYRDLAVSVLDFALRNCGSADEYSTDDVRLTSWNILSGHARHRDEGFGFVASAETLALFDAISAKRRPATHRRVEIAVRLRVPSYFPPFSFAHRASTAFLAISVRCAGESFAARALPPRDCKARS